ncbi:MAG: aldo/keto reductase [Acidimicrobiia bacterium]
MRYTNLGRTGLTVSRLCLGTMTFGFQCDEETSFSIMDAAYDADISFWDTANVYPLGGGLDHVGRTEQIIGKWMRQRKRRREDIVLATKCVGRMGPNRWEQGASRKHVLTAVEDSLRRLGTDYVDLYQLHSDDTRTPLEEQMEALDLVVRSGKARYVGCSNFLAYRMARANGIAAARHLVRFDSVQPRYNMLFRQIERELLPLCDEESIGVIPYNPLAGGLLSGKHSRTAPPETGTRFTIGTAGGLYQERYWHEREFDTVDAVRALAAEAGMSMVTMSVAWVLANPTITAPIVGASKASQLAENVAALDVTLDADLKRRLDELTHDFRFGDATR